MQTQPAADLHVHTTASDGTLTIQTLPAAAKRAGLNWVAVTDHDRIHPKLPAVVSVRDGIRIIRGIELRVETADQRLDLLGYGVKPTAELTAELDRLQTDRVERARKIIDRVEQQTGVTLDLRPQPGVGRPHIARAIDASEAAYDYSEAFGELIGSDSPCYVPREITPADRGIDLLNESCSVVGLAHPFRYCDPEAALKIAAELDAVERYYPYGREVEVELVERTIDRHGLLATGGSDAHNTTLGRAGPPNAPFEAFRERLSDIETS